jgi:membrane-associated phospholipid phosphatase
VQSPSFVAAVGLVLALTAIGVLDPLVRLHPGITDGSFADRLLTAITSFGEGVQMLVGSALLVVAAASVDPAKLRRATRARVMNVAMVAGFAFVTIAGSGIVASLVKNIYGRARPEHLVGDAIFQLHSLSFRAKFASFPSGHSTTAGATAVVLALLFPRHARLILALGVGVAITRILLDAHFPADVVAGLTLGAVFTFAAAHWCARRGLIFRWAAGGSLALRPLARPMAWFDGLAAVLADRKRGGAAAPALAEIAPDAGSSGEKAASLDDAA